MLSNIVLDELDSELARRGHRFVRYADDVQIFVRSERAGQRVMASIRQFLEQRMRLKVNADKSGVRQPSDVHFLGFRFQCRTTEGVCETAVLISQGKDTECTAAPGLNTAPISVGFRALRSLARSPDRPGLSKASLAFGAAACLRLLPHTGLAAPGLGRLTTAIPACSCLQLAVATNSLRRGLPPPIQCPCLAHQCWPSAPAYGG